MMYLQKSLRYASSHMAGAEMKIIIKKKGFLIEEDSICEIAQSYEGNFQSKGPKGKEARAVNSLQGKFSGN